MRAVELYQVMWFITRLILTEFQLKTTKDENSHCYWYVELWEEFSKCKKTLQSEERNELMDIADDTVVQVNDSA